LQRRLDRASPAVSTLFSSFS